jgi:hypothetical protein
VELLCKLQLLSTCFIYQGINEIIIQETYMFELFAASATEEIYRLAEQQHWDAQQGNNNKHILYQILAFKHKLFTAYTCRR